MSTSRRTVLKGGVAAAALAGAPGIVRAQTRPAASKTVRAVMHGDLRSFDPIWTTANISAYHGAMIYDTLFGIDAQQNPKPQMVDKWQLSEDKKTYTFQLRDGLKFSDGTPVTAADAVASVRRWAARDGGGQHMMLRVADLSAKDDKTFEMKMKQPYGLTLDVFAKTSTPLCFIMRKKEAETDPNQQITEYVGSGPFTFNQSETKPGNRYVYDKNPNYVPRAEPPSGISGGKVVKLDRVIYENIADEQTAMAALQSGEIDFYEVPPIDLLPQLEGDSNIKLQVLSELGNVGWLRVNYLHPPFNNPKARQAMLYLLNQEDFMKATFGNPKYYKTCGSLFTCGSPMENDVNTDWFKGKQNLAKAKQLFAESGYDGRPVYVMQATNIAFMNNSAQLVAQLLRQIGVNVRLEASDWGSVITRRAVKTAPDQGGWNIFITWAGGNAVGSPIALSGHAANGEKGWFGWPSDEKHEMLRDKWAEAPTLDARKAVARELQENAWNFVPHLYLGQWVHPVAYRSNIRGMVPVPEVVPWWNVEKT
jgi:peptide/nickel transport system substrate-binding protein